VKTITGVPSPRLSCMAFFVSQRRFGNVPLSAANVLLKIDDKTLDGTPEFCIDAGSRGNVARFINHSCEPNLFVQCILSAHHDLRLARVVLFAAENISPLQVVRC